MNRPTHFPDFRDPPVVEVALGVQFEPLLRMQSRHLALLAEHWRDQFPRWEEHPPLPAASEWFGVPGQTSVNVRFDFGALPPLRRSFFVNESGTELRQVQADRFVRNWRKMGNPYPRYEHVRDRFREDIDEFASFIQKHELGRFAPNQCEVTYVNHVPTSGDRGAATLSGILEPWSGDFPDDFLSNPESVEVALHFVIKDKGGSNVGRLHINVAPARDQSTNDLLTRLTLTARGSPSTQDIDGVIAFLNLGREHIVRGFASLTTERMHEKWGRTT